ncbi:RNA-directed DNA polymerase, eukaryota, partial [Tanacetum coccineum]
LRFLELKMGDGVGFAAGRTLSEQLSSYTKIIRKFRVLHLDSHFCCDGEERRKTVVSAVGEDQGGSSMPRPIGLISLIASVDLVRLVSKLQKASVFWWFRSTFGLWALTSLLFPSGPTHVQPMRGLIMMEEDFMPLYVIDPSNLKLKDYFRKEGIHFDPVQVYAGKDNLFSIKLHHDGKFTPSPKRRYVGGKLNYVDKIDMDPFNVDELHMFVKDLGYDPKQLMFYHYKLPDKSLDYGLRPLSCDADVVSLIKLVANYLIHTNPQIPIKVVQEHMQKQFQVGVSKTKAFRAKAKAEVQLRGDQEQQYALLWDYYGFWASGRQLLGLDGAFMKGNYPGQMLTAVSVDANNGIYPVAYGIVESESKESWTWFLSCLGDDLDLEANSNFTFITDRQKGLLPALKDLFPAAEHIYCVRHIHDNMNLIYKGGQYKELLWKCATATTEVHFERAIDEFKGQLLEARDSPVITALEYVKEYLMKRIVIVQKVNEGRQNQVVVNLANRSRTCKKWEVSSIPCKHAVACIFNMTDNGMQINPVPGREFWAKTQVPSRLIPPYIPPQVGRPGKKRKKSACEVTEMVKDGKFTRKGGTVTCCKCGQKGHNKRSCKGPTFAGSGSTSGPSSTSQPARAFASASASQPARASARAKQPQRATSQPASAPKTTRPTKTKNVAEKMTPTRQSQRQKSAKKTPTTK